MQLTKNFSLAEFEYSETAARYAYDNTIPRELYPNLARLAEALQHFRDLVGKPVVLSSGYRSLATNEKVGGSKTSAHMKALAADLRVVGMTTTELFAWIRENRDALPRFDQVIDEFGRWVHIGLADDGKQPRRQFLLARTINPQGRVGYTEVA